MNHKLIIFFGITMLALVGCASSGENNFYNKVDGEIVASENLPKKFNNFELAEFFDLPLKDNSLKVTAQYIDEELDEGFLLTFYKLNGDVLTAFEKKELDSMLNTYKPIDYKGNTILEGYKMKGWFISNNEFIEISIDEKFLTDGVILDKLIALFPVDEKTSNY